VNNDFIHKISKYTPIILFLIFSLILAPENVKLVRSITLTDRIKVSISIKDVVFIVFLISMIFITIEAIKNKDTE